MLQAENSSLVTDKLADVMSNKSVQILKVIEHRKLPSNIPELILAYIFTGKFEKKRKMKKENSFIY